MKCNRCGTVLPEGARFCSSCGAEILPAHRHCARCGAEVAAGNPSCHRCGAQEKTPARNGATLETRLLWKLALLLLGAAGIVFGVLSFEWDVGEILTFARRLTWPELWRVLLIMASCVILLIGCGLPVTPEP